MAEKGKGKKIGKDAKRDIRKRYKLTQQKVKNMLVRIARSNGYDYALERAGLYNLTSWFKQRAKNFTFNRS